MKFLPLRRPVAPFKGLSHRQKLSVVVLVLALLACAPWIYRVAAWQYNSTVCSASGGTWTPVGLAQRPACIYPYPDGGKPCSSSEECIGNCMIYPDNRSEKPDPALAVCQWSTNGFGCSTVVEDPEYFLCAD